MKDLLLWARVVVRTSNMKISRRYLAESIKKNAPKRVSHVQNFIFPHPTNQIIELWRCICRCRCHILTPQGRFCAVTTVMTTRTSPICISNEQRQNLLHTLHSPHASHTPHVRFDFWQVSLTSFVKRPNWKSCEIQNSIKLKLYIFSKFLLRSWQFKRNSHLRLSDAIEIVRQLRQRENARLASAWLLRVN